MTKFGVSLSIKQCRNFGITSNDCIDWLVDTGGFRRFRLMSYWDEIEPTQGEYTFDELDRQIEQIGQKGGEISLCLGARQPRWPENHWPEWAWQLAGGDRTQALLGFIEAVVSRYKNQPHITSYQLENEALLKSFGRRADVDRSRLRQEYKLVKQLDPTRPVIMTTSTSWGIPLRRPIPDIVGFSYYQVVYNSHKQAYTTAFHKPWLHRLRAQTVRVLWQRPSLIHELQLEPWGPKNIWEMPMDEQMKSMSPAQVQANLQAALQTELKTIDLWGGEWWYWCSQQRRNPEIVEAILKLNAEL